MKNFKRYIIVSILLVKISILYGQGFPESFEANFKTDTLKIISSQFGKKDTISYSQEYDIKVSNKILFINSRSRSYKFILDKVIKGDKNELNPQIYYAKNLYTQEKTILFINISKKLVKTQETTSNTILEFKGYDKYDSTKKDCNPKKIIFSKNKDKYYIITSFPDIQTGIIEYNFNQKLEEYSIDDSDDMYRYIEYYYITTATPVVEYRKYTKLNEPKTTFKKKGIVTVKIFINNMGQVIKAEHLRSPLNSKEKDLIEFALESALKCIFETEKEAIKRSINNPEKYEDGYGYE